ncbi:hypothetical protein NPIL_564051 [Nephila pilipes]|uniref:Uncharacterized protein n=1 Tax=Nephila pilipes TaxID=299642 RepID=A0A8X6PMA9_NEPPI|nr:hypothetical protein NPIL_564051 [Nephila pilipes]
MIIQNRKRIQFYLERHLEENKSSNHPFVLVYLFCEKVPATKTFSSLFLQPKKRRRGCCVSPIVQRMQSRKDYEENERLTDRFHRVFTRRSGDLSTYQPRTERLRFRWRAARKMHVDPADRLVSLNRRLRSIGMRAFDNLLGHSNDELNSLLTSYNAI